MSKVALLAGNVRAVIRYSFKGSQNTAPPHNLLHITKPQSSWSYDIPQATCLNISRASNFFSVLCADRTADRNLYQNHRRYLNAACRKRTRPRKLWKRTVLLLVVYFASNPETNGARRSMGFSGKSDRAEKLLWRSFWFEFIRYDHLYGIKLPCQPPCWLASGVG